MDPSGWRRPDEAAPFLGTLELALRTGRQIAMTYQRAYDQSVVERIANPLGLVAKGSVWYLAATVDGKSRTYRASRIRAVTILETPLERPDGFDLAAFWTESSAEFRGCPADPSFRASCRTRGHRPGAARVAVRHGRVGERSGRARLDHVHRSGPTPTTSRWSAR